MTSRSSFMYVGISTSKLTTVGFYTTIASQQNQQHESNVSRVLTTPHYDGFVMQSIFAEMIPNSEMSLDHIHIIFTALLPCTFNEEDWRYHGRAVICGTPSIISTTGIVEALAKPREYYLFQLGSMREDVS